MADSGSSKFDKDPQGDKFGSRSSLNGKTKGDAVVIVAFNFKAIFTWMEKFYDKKSSSSSISHSFPEKDDLIDVFSKTVDDFLFFSRSVVLQNQKDVVQLCFYEKKLGWNYISKAFLSVWRLCERLDNSFYLNIQKLPPAPSIGIVAVTLPGGIAGPAVLQGDPVVKLATVLARTSESGMVLTTENTIELFEKHAPDEWLNRQNIGEEDDTVFVQDSSKRIGSFIVKKDERILPSGMAVSVQLFFCYDGTGYT